MPKFTTKRSVKGSANPRKTLGAKKPALFKGGTTRGVKGSVNPKPTLKGMKAVKKPTYKTMESNVVKRATPKKKWTSWGTPSDGTGVGY